MERFARQVATVLSQVLDGEISANDLEIPPNRDLGDFAFPCFKLSKQWKKSPPQIAQDLSQRVQTLVPEGISAKNVGPYVNFTVNPKQALSTLLNDILNENDLGSYGKITPESRGIWVLEYSSPNVAKHFQVYHARPTLLGAALDRIGRYRGFDVHSINHLGDWGTQFGKLFVAYSLYKDSIPNPPSIDDLVTIYVKVHEEIKTRPELEVQAREAFNRLEKGDPELTEFWKKCIQTSLKEFNRIYDTLGVKFDHIWGESFYTPFLGKLLNELRQKGLLVESEGAWVVPVKDDTGNDLPPCILQKSDGATIYATRDVAAAIYRQQQFHFDRMTYIVGREQMLHFKQIFYVLKQMGHEWVNRCEHVPTGLYRFNDSKMSTRKGNFITFDSVLNEARARVAKILQARGKSDDEANEIIEPVAVGAIVFHDLSTDPVKDVDFDPERMVDFDGETGPYLQYAHTRCLSILRKANARPVYQEDLIARLQAPEELALVKMLGQFPLHLERSLQFAKASQLAIYLIDLTKVFNQFYRECHVLTEDQQLSSSRLLLVEATRRIMARGLSLLGVPLPERM